MIFFIRALAAAILILGTFTALAQPGGQRDSIKGQLADIRFVFEQQRTSDSTVQLIIKALTTPDRKLFALQKGEEYVLYSQVSFDSSVQEHLVGSIQEAGAIQQGYDTVMQTAMHYTSDSLLWQQTIKAVLTDSLVVKGMISYLYQKGEEFLPGEKSFKFYVLPQQQTGLVGKTADEGSIATRSLRWIFFTAFGGGLLALLTPCVYSMIPVTVSFFTKRSKTRAEGIRNAIYYATSIVLIFTLFGFLITLIFGPAALNNLATNWAANLVFFALFLIFGLSFLGAFEISLPASWSTKTDSKAGTGNFLGIFFMALTLAVVSFSCTGPIIGNLLVLAAKGSYWGPLTGMAGFSIALALPFALFAFFPSKLNVLGKAGGWLNAVKVTLGFLELALALKFLSNADLARGWRFLDREIFIAAWIVIFVLLGIYLLGKLKLHHDDELPKNDFGLPYLSVTRLLVAMIALIFAVYMIPGLWGAPLKGISAFIPPMGTQDFNASAGKMPTGGDHSPVSNALPHPQKYYEQMRVYEPEVVTKYGMLTYFDYEEALEIARKAKKPLMLDFTGINCVNCRKMEGQVWSDPEVMKRLKEDFVIASLYVDVHHIELQPQEQYFSEALNKQVETLGDKYADFQVTRFGANTQPYYFFLDGKEQRLIEEGYGYDPDIEQFVALLEKAKQQFYKNNATAL
jgi:thiol:disulfide interchange protein